MSLSVYEGNIFTTKCQTIVNTVNCVGVMGAGIALECKLRYPEMYEKYASLCNQQMINIGALWLYKSPERWILNFPTKKHWKDPSREEYLHKGLQKFLATYEEKGIKTIAFPLLGAQNGGIDKERSQEIMESYLKKCSIPVEIYLYNPMAPDDLFDRFKAIISHMTTAEIKNATGLRTIYVQHVLDALNNPTICQLNCLARVKGIGEGTLQKIFNYACGQMQSSNRPVQQSLEL